jgi:hypothetical protein
MQFSCDHRSGLASHILPTRCLALLLASAAPALPQQFNLDLEDPDQLSPTDTNAGAASQPGFWQEYGFIDPIFLKDITGTDTSVLFGTTAQFIGTINDPLTTGDDELLMDDSMSNPGTMACTFTGLVDGQYTIYTFAWRPDGPQFINTVGVAQSSEGPKDCGGVWPGTHQKAFRTSSTWPRLPAASSS